MITRRRRLLTTRVTLAISATAALSFTVRFAGHGAASGIPLEMELAHVYTMRDGKAARAVEYMDRVEALEATGLEESPGFPRIE